MCGEQPLEADFVHKKTSVGNPTEAFLWRRRRDSNPRAAFDTAYALSRGASSPLEYFSMC